MKEIQNGQMPVFRYFTESEILNPLFDSCPYDKWEDLPKDIATNLSYTMEVVDLIRDAIGEPIRINSSYRVQEAESAHKYGKAIDFQFIDNEKEFYLEAMDFLQHRCREGNLRAILEWRGIGLWIHIDRNYKDIGQKVLMVAYPKDAIGKVSKQYMQYAFYRGISPDDAYQNYV